ncbi:hypothetical protein CAOG_00015 [Capsaspora owczarzaki ATCC 30864]|nr:hypothetical protein CAOG_00015 [Capsaspora owczarzaki ATCC 30864]|eukprot:XP_004364886.1 hypothetical protein CAOG_00015 [Capsaspora owczarzaki ATCC 30864]
MVRTIQLLLAATVLVLTASSAHAVQYRATCFARALYFTQNSGCGDGTCDPYCWGWVRFAPNGNANWNAGQQANTASPRWNIDLNYGVVNNWEGTVQWYVDCDDADPAGNPDDDMGWRTFNPITLNGNQEQGSLTASPWEGVDLGGTTGGEFNIGAVYVYHRAMCDQYWYGARCGEYCRVSDPPACTECKALTGECKCNPGYQDKDCGTCSTNYWQVGTSGQPGFQCVYCLGQNTASACYSCQAGGVKVCCDAWKGTECNVKKSCGAFPVAPANSARATDGTSCTCSGYQCTCKYSCSAGYTATPVTSTCGFDEQWTTVAGLQCLDVNECAPGGGNLCAQNCTNTIGDYTCSCMPGYNQNGDGRGEYGCTGIDECATAGQGGCAQDCTNTPLSYYCGCFAGFTLAPNGKDCTDNNECTLGTHNCDSHASCTNTYGGFYCTCNAGFTGAGTAGTCVNTNECGQSPCVANAACVDSPGSFTCTCNAGYTGDAYVSHNGWCAHVSAVSFADSSVMVVSKPASGNITVTLQVNASASVDLSSVQFSVVGTNATAGVDYVVLTASPLVFNVSDTSRVIQVAILSNSFTTNLQSLNVQLHDPVHLVVDRFNNATVIINAAGTVRFAQASRAFSVNITAGSYALTVERVSASSLARAVNVTIYRSQPAPQWFSVVIAVNQLTAVLTVPLAMSTAPSFDTVYTYTITNATLIGSTARPPYIGDYATAAVTALAHNYPNGLIAWRAVSLVLQEGTGSYVTIDRAYGTNGSVTVRVRTVTLTYAQSGGVALASTSDYTSFSQLLTFAEDVNTLSVIVSTSGDTQPEVDEMFGVLVELVSGGATVDPTKSLLRITIAENDDAHGIISMTPVYTCNDESPIVGGVAQPNNTVKVLLRRAGGLFGDITFTWSTHDGVFNNASLASQRNASGAMSDYVVANQQRVIFPAGVDRMNLNVVILDDTVPELDEYFYAQLDGVPIGGAVIDPVNNYTNLCIARNDNPYGLLGIELPSPMTLGPNGQHRFIVYEGGFVNVTIHRYYGTFHTVSGVVSLVNENTTNADFGNVNNIAVTFSEGVSSVSVAWPIANDLANEPYEMFGVKLVANGASSGQEATSVVTTSSLDSYLPCVIDASSSSGVIRFQSLFISVQESDGDAILTVSRSPNASSVTYSSDAVPGTASGSDFDASNQNNTHLLPVTDSTQQFSIHIANDNIPEGDESFYVSLVNVSGAYLSWASVATVTILANDDGYGVVEFAPSTLFDTDVYHFYENATYIRLPVWREVGAIGRINMTFEISTNRSASPDYLAFSRVALPSLKVDMAHDIDPATYEIVMADGQNETEIVIPVFDIPRYQGTKYMFVHLKNIGGGARFGASRAVVVMILDLDSAPTSSGASSVDAAIYTIIPSVLALLLLLLLIIVVVRRRRQKSKVAKVAPAFMHRNDPTVGQIELNPLHQLNEERNDTYDDVRPGAREGLYDTLGGGGSSVGNPTYDSNATYDSLSAANYQSASAQYQSPAGQYQSPAGQYDNFEAPVYDSAGDEKAPEAYAPGYTHIAGRTASDQLPAPPGQTRPQQYAALDHGDAGVSPEVDAKMLEAAGGHYDSFAPGTNAPPNYDNLPSAVNSDATASEYATPRSAPPPVYSRPRSNPQDPVYD